MTELERDFTFSLTKYPSLIFVFLVVMLLHLLVQKCYFIHLKLSVVFELCVFFNETII